MSVPYQLGHFVKLRDLNRWETSRWLHPDVNIFEIRQINADLAVLDHLKDPVPISDIEPVPIDGIADLYIYYDPVVMASIVSSEGAIKSKSRDRSYYIKRFEDCFDEQGNSFIQLIREAGCEYVHQVQDFLRERFNKSDLKIDAI